MVVRLTYPQFRGWSSEGDFGPLSVHSESIEALGDVVSQRCVYI